MLDTFFGVFKILFEFLKIPLFILLCFLACFAVSVAVFLFVEHLHGNDIKKRLKMAHIKRPFILKLFIDVPRQFAHDLSTKDVDFFPYQGCIIFCGRQGSGKTISLVEFSKRMHGEYPRSVVLSNLNLSFQSDSINHWSKLLTAKNGIKGVICCLDELQNWFGSNQSRNFPPEMLSVITQNRKNRRIILGTSQSFHLLAKSIRSQCTEVRDCMTLLGCLTIVVRREPFLNSDGDVEKLKYRGFYFFVHDKSIRDSYDTWHVIESLSSSGFVDKQQRID